MSLSPGFTSDEIRALVLEYERQPHGTKAAWLRGKGLKVTRFRRWRDAVLEGDLDRGLVPREGSSMMNPKQRRQSAAELARQEAREAELLARIAQLEATNEVLGKAIGLLHQLSEQEPDTPETNEPSSSS